MVHPVQQANEGGNGGATMPRLSSASMRSTSSISSNEYPIQASTLGRPSLVQNQPQMYRQSSATPPSSLGSRQSTPPSQYGVMTRPSARPPSPPLPPPPMQQQSLPQVINIFSTGYFLSDQHLCSQLIQNTTIDFISFMKIYKNCTEIPNTSFSRYGF